MKTYFLMAPGPVALAKNVLDAMSRQVVLHYGSEWVKTYEETISLLKQIFATEGEVFTLVGSGSMGLEAAVGSVVSDEYTTLVLSNGFFGERLAAIARSYTDRVHVEHFPLNKPIDPNVLASRLHDDEFIKVVIAVHCETVSGILNPIEQLGSICKEKSVLFVVDAVSTLGGVPFQMDSWGVGITITASQKCLGGPPGLGIVAVGKSAWELIEKKKQHGWYTDLNIWREAATMTGSSKRTPVTLATPAFCGLRQAIRNLLSEEPEERYARYAQAAAHLRSGLRECGFKLFAPLADCSPTVTVCKSQPECSAEHLVNALKEEHGIRIAGGAGELTGKVFRIGHMGDVQTRPESIDRLLSAVRAVVKGDR